MYANKQEPICIPELGLRVPFRQRAIGNQQNQDGKGAESNGEEKLLAQIRGNEDGNRAKYLNLYV